MRKIYLFLPFLVACSPDGSENVMNNDQVSSSYQSETASDESPGSMAGLITYRLVEAQPGSPMPTFHAAAYQGTLTKRGACVGLMSGGEFMPLAFVEGTAAWDDQRERLTVDGKTFDLGDSIGVGGSSSGGPIVESIVDAAPPDCSNQTIWFVAVNSVELQQ
tara:strand:+ start:1039 stop:1524 length:486 start_codon:yes stop_codon:yes gene_type:complete